MDEKIQLSLSKIAGYDLQINNLVKHNKSDFFQELQDNLIEKINKSNIFIPIEKNDIGFLNLSLNHIYLMKNITNTQSDFKNGQSSKIIFDYGGPNIGKPLHVGHMRTLNIGRSLYNIHSFIGNEVVSDIHLGDWGMPIAQIITYLEKEKIELQSLDSSQLEIVYPKASEEYKKNNEFKTRAQEINKLLNNNDQELLKMWESIKKISIQSLKEDFEIFGHSFDYWLGESDVNNLIPKMIEELFASRTRNSIGKIKANRQDLSFAQLRIYYEEKHKPLNQQFKKNLELLTPQGDINYAGYLLADENNLSVKVAKYKGTTRADLAESNEYGNGSLIKATKSVLDKIALENRTLTQITSKERLEKRLWNGIALREAIINAFVHNDYTRELGVATFTRT